MEAALPLSELRARWARCRDLLREHLPAAGGLVVFSRLNIYYLTGTFANGLFWLPLDGTPVLLCRRGLERARSESPLSPIHAFNSYREVLDILKDAGAPLPDTAAVEMNGLSWALSNSFRKYLPGKTFLPGDRLLALARATKSEWELGTIRDAGQRHGRCLVDILPRYLREGMTELEVAHRIFEVFFGEGHQGILRMEAYGEEVFLGHIAAGESGNHPSVFNGPLGLLGVHPAVPHMGSGLKSWKRGEPLAIDNGFMLDGYQTDKTQVYWLGDLGSMPAPVRAAQDFCFEMQAWIAGRLKPGTLPSDVWRHCHARAEKTGWGEGFMGLGGNKVNFVGHGIGLAVDEYPVLAQGFDLPLETGMVIAVEPKIGLPGVGMIGVENTFEVSPEGGRCLTALDHRVISVPL